MPRALNGTTQYFINTTALVGVSNFTVSLWFKGTNNAVTQYPFCMGNSVGTDINYIALVGGNSIWCGAFNSVSGGASAQATGLTLTNGVWYNVVCVWETTSARCVVFQGVKTGNGSTASVASINRTVFGSLYSAGVNGGYFAGSIAHVGMWSTSLAESLGAADAAQECFSLNKGCSPMKIRPAALVDYWPCVGPAGDAVGVKGTILTATGSPTEDSAGPPVYL